MLIGLQLGLDFLAAGFYFRINVLQLLLAKCLHCISFGEAPDSLGQLLQKLDYWGQLPWVLCYLFVNQVGNMLRHHVFETTADFMCSMLASGCLAWLPTPQ